MNHKKHDLKQNIITSSAYCVHDSLYLLWPGEMNDEIFCIQPRMLVCIFCTGYMILSMTHSHYMFNTGPPDSADEQISTLGTFSRNKYSQMIQHTRVFVSPWIDKHENQPTSNHQTNLPRWGTCIDALIIHITERYLLMV
jgi:hypothetical protein